MADGLDSLGNPSHSIFTSNQRLAHVVFNLRLRDRPRCILGDRIVGNRKGCSYIIERVNPQDEMDVIGQDDEFIQRNGGEPPR